MRGSYHSDLAAVSRRAPRSLNPVDRRAQAFDICLDVLRCFYGQFHSGPRGWWRWRMSGISDVPWVLCSTATPRSRSLTAPQFRRSHRGALVRGLAVRVPQHSSGDSGAGPVSDRLHRVILQMSIALGGGLVFVTKNSLDHKKALATSRCHRCEGSWTAMSSPRRSAPDVDSRPDQVSSVGFRSSTTPDA